MQECLYDIFVYIVALFFLRFGKFVYNSVEYPGFWFGGDTFGGRTPGGPGAEPPLEARELSKNFTRLLRKIAKNALF